jgi:hypothetical protein
MTGGTEDAWFSELGLGSLHAWATWSGCSGAVANTTLNVTATSGKSWWGACTS